MAFSIAWDAYQKNLSNGLSLLQQRGKFVDMTIAADGHHVKAHQVVLSLVSPYIGDLISSAACPHPVIFLNQVSYQTLQSILQYAYTGEVMVARDKIADFLDACKALHIKGVEDLCSTSEEIEDHDINTTESIIETTSTEQPMKLQKKGYMANPLVEKKEWFSIASDNDTMDTTTYDHDQNPYHCGGSKPVPTSVPLKSKLSIQDSKAISDNLQYTVSNKGSLQLVCNRYLYFLMSSRKNGERMWRCVTYWKKCACRAYLVTKENRVIKRVSAHTHTFHDSQILKKLNSGNMFSALNEVEYKKKKESTRG